MKRIDLAGQKFGRLTAIKFDGVRHKVAVWACVCDCGSELTVHGTKLRTGKTISCGCFRRELTKERMTTHGDRKTPTYNTWRSIIDRCTSPNATKYPDYGGAGITLCKEWESYENFRRDMGPRPEGCTIDRIDNSMGYCKENCRWATAEQQARNKRKQSISFEDATKIRAMKAQGMRRRDIINSLSITAGAYGSVIYAGNVSAALPTETVKS